jgi:hypothetical protein
MPSGHLAQRQSLPYFDPPSAPPAAPDLVQFRPKPDRRRRHIAVAAEQERRQGAWLTATARGEPSQVEP